MNLFTDVTTTGVGIIEQVYSEREEGESVCIQVIGNTTAGAGSLVVAIEVSNNSTDWILASNITLTLATTVATDGIVINAPWKYIRAYPTTLTGTGAKASAILNA